MLVINPAWPSSFVKHNLEIDRATFSTYLAEYELILRDVLDQLEHTPNESRCVMASTAESINQLSECRAKSLGCGAANDSFAIDPDGNVYPCGLFLENDDYCIGNIRTEISLDKILGVQQKISDLSSKCKHCWAVSFCGAACLPMAIAQGCEDSAEPTSYCDLFRGYIERDLLLYAEIYLRFGTTQFIGFSSNNENKACESV
jgi:radical SAM protein with 4Fe4S-binding SPASM domain